MNKYSVFYYFQSVCIIVHIYDIQVTLGFLKMILLKLISLNSNFECKNDKMEPSNEIIKNDKMILRFIISR